MKVLQYDAHAQAELAELESVLYRCIAPNASLSIHCNYTRRRTRDDAVRGRVQRSQDDPVLIVRPDTGGNIPESCAFDALCEGGASYPKAAVDAALRKSDFDNQSFGAVFGPACVDRPDAEAAIANVGVRNAFDFREKPICNSFRRYIRPQRARTTGGEWRFVVNTEEYTQGVTVDICREDVKGELASTDEMASLFPALLQAALVVTAAFPAPFLQPRSAASSTLRTACWP